MIEEATTKKREEKRRRPRETSSGGTTNEVSVICYLFIIGKINCLSFRGCIFHMFPLSTLHDSTIHVILDLYLKLLILKKIFKILNKI